MEKISLFVGFILIFCDVNGSPSRENRDSRVNAALLSVGQSFADPPTKTQPPMSTANSTKAEPITMTTSGSTMEPIPTNIPANVTANITTPGHDNSTTEPITASMTTVFSNLTTQPANSSSKSPSEASTSSSRITSESTVTSSIPHSFPRTTPRAATPSKKNKFEAWSFLGGAAVGLFVTLACVGLVYCINNRKKYPHDSVQYRAM